MIFLLFGWQIKETLARTNSLGIPLYEKKNPNEILRPNDEFSVSGKNLKISKVRIPTISVFLPVPNKAIGAALIICPARGYSFLDMNQVGAFMICNSSG